MCLAIPGKIVALTGNDPLTRMGRVDFGGASKEVALAFVPEAGLGDYVLVHAGFAIGRIREEEARRVFAYLQEIGELEELAVPEGAA